MKKLLLSFFCLLLAVQNYAQEGVEYKTLPTRVSIISPDSEHFDPSSLNISCHKEVVEPFVWDNSTKSYVGKIRCYFGDDIVNFTIGTPDNRIVCELEGFIENLESITEANFKVDFSQYHYVQIKAKDKRMSLYVDYIYSSEDDSGSSFPGGSHIYTNMVDNATWCKSGKYTYEPEITFDDAAVMTTEHYLIVDNRDVEEIIDIDMEKMHLVTFHVTGVEKKPLAGASIDVIPSTNADLDMELDTDDEGIGRAYLLDGSYYFGVDASYNNYFGGDDSIGEFTVSGKDIDVKYGFDDYKKVIFNISGIGLQSVALSIMKAYESNQDEYYESLSGEGVVAHEMYLPADGQFSYSINPTCSGYKFPVKNDVFEANTTDRLDIVFDEQNYTQVFFDVINKPEENYPYIKIFHNATLVRDLYIGDMSSKEMFSPGEYNYVLISNNSDLQSKGSFAISKGDEKKTITVDCAEGISKPVFFSVKNMPESIKSEYLSYEVKSENGMDLFNFSFYPGQEEPVQFSLPNGSYIFAISKDDSRGAFYHEQKVEVDDNNRNVEIDLGNYGTVRVYTTAPEGISVDDIFCIYPDGQTVNLYGEEVMVWLESGKEYSFIASGSDDNGFDMHSSEKKAVTVKAGEVVDVTLDLEIPQTDYTVSMSIRDRYAGYIKNAKVTINGEAYRSNRQGQVQTLIPVSGNSLTYRVEATGYETLEKTVQLSKMDILSQYVDIDVFLEYDGGVDGIEEQTIDKLKVLNTVVDGNLFIDNGTENMWNMIMVGLDGHVVINKNIELGINDIGVENLASGFYIVVLSNGTEQKSVKIIKR